MKVKQLVWDIDELAKSGVVGETIRFESTHINYSITCDFYNNELAGYSLSLGIGYPERLHIKATLTISEAVNYAQKHYESLIMSGLETNDE